MYIMLYVCVFSRLAAKQCINSEFAVNVLAEGRF